MKAILFLLCMSVITGCATSYQESGVFSITGGYYEVPVNDQLTKVVFSGNGFIDHATASSYTLFRCAELAQKNNKPYFVIYQSLFHASVARPTQAISQGDIGGKPVTHTYVKFLDSKIEGALTTADVIKDRDAMKKKKAEERKQARTKTKKGDAK